MKNNIVQLEKFQKKTPYDSLKEIFNNDLDKVEAFTKLKLSSEVDLIRKMTLYQLDSGGKRLRSILTLASSKMTEYKGEHNIHLAACVELIHSATLLHDDVIDNSSIRRGKKTSNIIWGNQPSILVGDYFQLGAGSSDIMGALGWNRDTTNGVIYNTSFGEPNPDYLIENKIRIIDSNNKYHYLDFKHPSFIKEYSPITTTTGRPKYYSLFDEAAFELSPIPDSGYTAELHYLYKPASLTAGSDSGTTILSTDHPDPLLYGTLVEASVFLKEAPDVIANFEARFKEGISRMKNLSEGRNTRDEYRYDLLRTGVS